MEILTAIRIIAILFMIHSFIWFPKSKLVTFLSAVLLSAAAISALVAQISMLGVIVYTLFALRQFLELIELLKAERNPG